MYSSKYYTFSYRIKIDTFRLTTSFFNFPKFKAVTKANKRGL